MKALDRYFDLTARQTTVGRETRGALATFLTMAYILVANPAILVAAGMPRESAIVIRAPGAPVPVTLAPSPAIVAVGAAGAVMSGAVSGSVGEALLAASVWRAVSVSPFVCAGESVTV